MHVLLYIYIYTYVPIDRMMILLYSSHFWNCHAFGGSFSLGGGSGSLEMPSLRVGASFVHRVLLLALSCEDSLVDSYIWVALH